VFILHDGVAPNGVEAANKGETEPLRKGSRMAGLKRDGWSRHPTRMADRAMTSLGRFRLPGGATCRLTEERLCDRVRGGLVFGTDTRWVLLELMGPEVLS
jgi:hypothetical protein